MYVEQNPLHHARVQRGIRVGEVIARTLLSPRVVSLIDAGRFQELPGGLYARSYVRTFAAAVGLDPDETVRAVAGQLPPAEDPLPAMREVARAGDPAWVTALDDLRERAAAALAGTMEAWSCSTRRAVAAILDAALLLAILAVLLRVTAWMCGVTQDVLLDSAGGAVAVFWGILVLLYFGILGGAGGGTPGAHLSGLRIDAAGISLHRLPLARSAGM